MIKYESADHHHLAFIQPISCRRIRIIALRRKFVSISVNLLTLSLLTYAFHIHIQKAPEKIYVKVLDPEADKA